MYIVSISRDHTRYRLQANLENRTFQPDLPLTASTPRQQC